MGPWFTVEKIDGGTFAISEYKHREETHCYLLCGGDRACLIDTGLGVSNIKKVTDSLTLLPVAVLTTHAHWDHIGGHKYYKNIAVHENERDWLAAAFPLSLEAVKAELTKSPCDFPPEFRLEDYRVYRGAPDTVLRDGDVIDLGGRRVRVIHTPGHSPGHCCFYDETAGYLFSGDLLYLGCIDAYYQTTEPALLPGSVKRLREYSIKRILPGHHGLDVPLSIVERMESALDGMAEEGLLAHGKGTFDFGDFQIRV